MATQATRTTEQVTALQNALATSRKKSIEDRLKDAVTNDAKAVETELRQRFGPIPDRFHIKTDKEYDLTGYITGLSNNQGKNRERFINDLCDRSVIRLTEAPVEVEAEEVAAPVEPAPVEPAPVEPAPVEPAPAKPAKPAKKKTTDATETSDKDNQ